MEKTKNIIITILFSFIIVVVFFLNLISPDKEISDLERRKLTQVSDINLENLLKGNLSSTFEKYAADQFIFRDEFRSFKSFWSMKIFMQKDDNKMFEYKGALYKIEYPLNEANAQSTAEKINYVYNKYLKNMKKSNIYYSIIPDKNYYLKMKEYPVIDYKKLENIMSNELKELKYISILEELELEDFYNTDIHWKQENLNNVVDKINLSLGNELPSNIEYTKENVGKFYGTYYGQISSNVGPDDMYILTNDMIEKCTTFNYETQKQGLVYDMKKSKDKYDIYLSGATPLIEINNPNSKSNKELVLFRDSFGSSIAPLLLENYKKITLVDLRYISSEILENYIEFENQDILFLYSSLVINENILK